MKLKAALAMFGAVMALGVGTASANNGGGQYPPNPGDEGISVDKPVVEVGDSITVRARGLCSGAVWFELAGSSTVGLLISPILQVGEDGTASYTFTVPGPASDWYVAWAKQPPECLTELKTPVKVVDPDDDDEGEWPAPKEPSIGLDVIPQPEGAEYRLVVTDLCPGSATMTLTGGATATQTQTVGSDGTATFSFSFVSVVAFTATVTQDTCPTGTRTFNIANTKPAAGTTPAADPAPAAVTPTPAAAAPAVVTPAVVAPAAVAPAVIAPAAAAPTPAAAPSDLPATGANPASLLQIAAFAVAAGLGMVMVSAMRRRSRRTATTR